MELEFIIETKYMEGSGSRARVETTDALTLGWKIKAGRDETRRNPKHLS